jgi:hypothetical protein
VKPQRFIRDRIGELAGEASAFLRRRRIAQRPYARLYYTNGRSQGFPEDADPGRRLFAAAADLIELASR